MKSRIMRLDLGRSTTSENSLARPKRRLTKFEKCISCAFWPADLPNGVGRGPPTLPEETFAAASETRSGHVSLVPGARPGDARRRCVTLYDCISPFAPRCASPRALVTDGSDQSTWTFDDKLLGAAICFGRPALYWLVSHGVSGLLG